MKQEVMPETNVLNLIGEVWEKGFVKTLKNSFVVWEEML